MKPVSSNQELAVITGGSKGIGFAIAKEMAARGTYVVLVARNEADLQSAIEQIHDMGGAGAYYALDVSKYEEVRQAIEKVMSRHGRIDYLFNCAGIAVFGRFENYHYDEWARVISVNEIGLLNVTSAVIPHMKAAKRGHIVNIGSFTGIVPTPMVSVYGMTKHAIHGFTLSLKQELAEHNIDVMLACVGSVETAMVHNPMQEFCEREFKSFASRVALKVISPEACARKIVRGMDRKKTVVYTHLPLLLTDVLKKHFPLVFPQLYMYMTRKESKTLLTLDAPVASTDSTLQRTPAGARG